MLEMQNISKVFSPGGVNEHIVFRHFDLTIPTGQFVSVVGSNGSGKTTLLNLICGSVPADEGRIVMDGADITRLREHKRYRTIGRVYQDPAMGACGAMTVLENLAMADNKNKPYTITRGVDKRRIPAYREMLSALGLGLESKLGVPVESLSGGQRQVLSLLMCTLTPIRFLILDEHTAALDPKTADIAMELTERIVAQKQITTLMVTHNLRYALAYGHRLLMMHGGRIVMDREGADKAQTTLPEVLERFHGAEEA